jgi:hypothetical protein
MKDGPQDLGNAERGRMEKDEGDSGSQLFVRRRKKKRCFEA